MLPKINRLTKKKDFDTVFKGGAGIKNGFLIVKLLKSPQRESRFGIVVSKKISGKATVRNSVKRRLSEAVFNQLEIIKKPSDVVLITLPGIEKKGFLELQQLVVDSFKKLKLI